MRMNTHERERARLGNSVSDMFEVKCLEEFTERFPADNWITKVENSGEKCGLQTQAWEIPRHVRSWNLASAQEVHEE